MGETAEMMLDGTLCACCGEYLGGDDGYAIYCAGCAPDFEPYFEPANVPARHDRDSLCKRCGKKLRGQHALQQHIKDKHGIGN